MPFDYSQKKVLVTGGTKGIGAAIADLFLESGADVTVTGRNSTYEHKTSKKLNYLEVDFADELSTENFLQQDLKFDILINNAGINKIDFAEDISLEDFRQIQKINVEAPFRTSKALIPYMKNKGYGRIINISSVFGIVTKEKRTSYSISKNAIHGLTKTLAVELAQNNILVNTVSPGFIDTELTRKILSSEQINQMTSTVPIKRLGQPKEIAEVVLFLCSQKNTFITGQNIVADGGFTCV